MILSVSKTEAHESENPGIKDDFVLSSSNNNS